MAGSGNKHRVAVVGGGIAGLATAYFLGKAGIPVDLLESDEKTGGLAGSFDFDGLEVEKYYHFVCLPDRDLTEMSRELDLAGDLTWRSTRTAFFYEGRMYPFTSLRDLLRFSPISFPSRLNLGYQSLKWKLRSDWEDLDEISARDWLTSRLGKRTYDVIWSPLLTMKFGERFDQVSAAWLWQRVHRVFNSRRSVLSPQVMGYFRGGTESFLRQIRQRIASHGSEIFCRTPVESVRCASGRVSGLLVKGKETGYDAVILAVPLPQAAAMLPGQLADYRAQLERIAFLGVVCLVLWLDRPIAESFWCNIHDSRIPYNGAITYSKLNPETARGGALVYVPYYLPVTHARFTAGDEEILEEFLSTLPLLQPGMDRRVVRGYRVFRSRHAQAICTVGFRRIQPAHATPLPGLYLIDSTQLYPSDRTLSGTIGLARRASKLVLAQLNGENNGA